MILKASQGYEDQAALMDLGSLLISKERKVEFPKLHGWMALSTMEVQGVLCIIRKKKICWVVMLERREDHQALKIIEIMRSPSMVRKLLIFCHLWFIFDNIRWN